MNEQDTICAIATAQGGAIGIIRVSGKQALEITDRIFLPIKGKRLKERKPYSLAFGQIINETNDVIDEVLVSLFHAPHSYTGEDCVELSCHGSSYILQQTIQLLVKNGCRMAHPGEFTQRAFLNGKMDLSQAEAVADLISSSTEASHRLAMNQMRGGFQKELNELRNKLLHITSLLELELDFSDHEELEFADRSELSLLAAEIEQTISSLTDSFSVGNAIKNGIPVVIIGETNAGKSTLLNMLLREEKAIVSDIHGTTRDVIEDIINLHGVTFRFIDTAGIRQTEDTIENLGIERTYQKIEQAQIILWMVDATHNKKEIAANKKQILPYCNDKKLIILFNKTDLLTEKEKETLYQFFDDIPSEKIFISAKHGEGIHDLEQRLLDIASLPSISQNNVIITNIRHYEALIHALEAIRRSHDSMNMGLSGDLVSEDLRQCLYHLSDIVGEVTTDEVLSNIFKHFCIGK